MDKAVLQKTIKFIRNHLSDDLRLEKLAKHAFISPFHFQRMFKEAVGETPKQFISRLRLESAAHQLILQPNISILSLALDSGYQSLESFSRAFKRYYALSPDAFRRLSDAEKMVIIGDVIHKENSDAGTAFLKFGNMLDVSEPEIKVEVKNLYARKLIFLPTTLGSFDQIDALFHKVEKWAEVRGLASNESEPFGLFEDFPLFTAFENCSYLACYSLNEQPELSGDIQYMELPTRTYAVFEVSGDIHEMISKVNVFWKSWLPQSGYKIVHEHAIHFPNNEDTNIPLNKRKFLLYLTIKPA